MGQQGVILLLKAMAWSYYLSPALLRRWSAGLIGLSMALAGMRRDIVRANLERAFPGAESADRRKIIERDSYRHLARLGLEILMLFGPMRRFTLHQTELRGVEHWRKAREAGRGVILLSSHVGNWEVMAATGAVRAGMDLLIVTKHLKPEWLHQGIEAGRRACGVSATYEPRTLKDVLGQLNKNGTVGFVLDQYAGPPIGVRVPVFGTPVGTPSVVAALARRTGAPVLPVVNYRDVRGRIVTEIREPLVWKTGSEYSGNELANYELAANTAHYAAVLESDIREHAGQWLWIHRRFKGDLSPLREGEWLNARTRR